MWDQCERAARCLAGWSISAAVVAVGVLGVAPAALARDGVIEINQVRALAGSVTAGDAPGFPVSLTVPGAYVLTSDLTVSTTSASAIRIEAPGIEIDLNGFAILGPGTCTGTGSGISCPTIGSGTGVTGVSGSTQLHNGTIRGFNGNGTVLGAGSRLTNLHVLENSASGIQVVGQSEVSRCVVARNGLSGIAGQRGSQLHRNIVYGNGATGITGNVGTRIAENSAWQNGSRGFTITGSGDTGGLLEYNAASENAGGGALIGSGVLAFGNSIKDNTGTGLGVVQGAGYGFNNLRGNTNVTITVTNGDIDNNVCEGNLICP